MHKQTNNYPVVLLSAASSSHDNKQTAKCVCAFIVLRKRDMSSAWSGTAMSMYEKQRTIAKTIRNPYTPYIPEARAEYVWGCVCVCVRLCNWVSEWVWRRILHRQKKMDVDDILYTYIYRNDDDDHQADSIRWQVRKKEEAFLTITKQQHFATNNIIQ